MSTPITRRTVLAGTGAAALLSATGVSLADEHDDDEEDLEEDDPMFAAVNTVHASPDAPEVDVYVNGARVLEAVKFHDISDYLVMLEGEYQVQIVPVEDEEMDDESEADDDNGFGDDDDDDDNGFGDDDDDDDNGFGDDDDDDDNGFGDDDDDDDDDVGMSDDDDDVGVSDDDDEVDLEEDAVIDEQIDVPAGVATAAVVGEVEEGAEQELELLVLDVDIEDLEDDESRVRAVHASPDAPEVDIVADDDPLVEGLEFGDYETVDVEEGEYSLEVRETGEDESVADFDVTLEAGVAYSAFAVGYLEEEDDEDNGFGDDENDDNDNGFGDDENDDNDNGFGDDDEDNGMGEDVDTGFDLLLNIDALTPQAEVEEMPKDDEDDEMDDDDDEIGTEDDDDDFGDDDDDDGIGDDDDDDGIGDDDDDDGIGDDDDDDNGI